MEWSKAAIDVLIETYSKEICLYNNKSPLYHNRYARKKALDKICDALKEIVPSTSGDIISKMKSLRTTFVNEFNKVNKSKKSGCGTEELYKPTLWYFEKLMFLKDHVQPRKGTSTATVDICTTNEASQAISEFSVASELATSLSEVPIVENWELMDPIPSTSYSDDMPPSDPSSTHPNEPSTSFTQISKGQKRKRLMYEEDRLIKEASEILSSVAKKEHSDLDAMGAFIASALKGLKNKALVIKGKRVIFDAIVSLQEEDMENE